MGAVCCQCKQPTDIREKDENISTDAQGATPESIRAFERQSLEIVDSHTDFLRRVGYEAPRSLTETFGIFNIDLNNPRTRQANIIRYLNACAGAPDLVITLSCFAAWNKYKKINSHAKVIPAIPETYEAYAGPGAVPLRVFFFDDNLDLVSKRGRAEDPGICNLRDVVSGEFVRFCDGENGFLRERFGRHTVLHASNEYRTCLVQANILDAMEDEKYFTSILMKYSQPGEKLLVFMDVNSTIICNDTITDKDMSDILLSTMFEFIELRPKEKFEFAWDGKKPLKVEKPMTFKAMIKKIAGDDKTYYKEFYSYARCINFLQESLTHGEVVWASHGGGITQESFSLLYEEYLETMVGGATGEGVTKSWFNAWKYLQAEKHAAIINSYGVDTRKVTCQTVDDERHALLLTVNFELWDSRDVKKFEEQYGLGMDRTGLPEVYESEGTGTKDGKPQPTNRRPSWDERQVKDAQKEATQSGQALHLRGLQKAKDAAAVFESEGGKRPSKTSVGPATT